MKINDEVLTPFIGGEIEIQNNVEEYFFRGGIKAITFDDSTLTVKALLDWMAEGKGFPASPFPTSWVMSTHKDYGASLEIYTASNIGPSPDGGDDRICLYSSIVNETVVLFPANGSKFDQSKIQG